MRTEKIENQKLTEKIEQIAQEVERKHKKQASLKRKNEQSLEEFIQEINKNIKEKWNE